MHIVTTAHMRQLEQAAVHAGSTWAELMEQAGTGVARVAQQTLHTLGQPAPWRVVVLVGPGNNGGDGLVVARELHDAGAQVVLALWKRSNPEDDANWQACRARNIPELAAEPASAELGAALGRAHLLVDALLGMGISRPVSGPLSALVDLVNQQRRAPNPPHVLAIDLPTGINSDSGQVMGVAIQADTSVATGLVKRGMLLYPGTSYAGQREVVPIGIPPEQLETLMSQEITREQARRLLPARPADSHKGTFGKALVIAGSLHYPGAAALATAGAGRAGAGLVTLATARSLLAASGRGPEVTLLPLPEASIGTLAPAAAEEVHKKLADYQALLVGPGLGQEEPTATCVQRLLGLEKQPQRPRVGFRSPDAPDPDPNTGFDRAALPATVLDADALNILAKVETWWETLPRERCILTPHPGEMKRLLGLAEQESLADDRVAVATEAAARWGQFVVLKGATTVVAAPAGSSFVLAAGNPALATAGTGDVLAGAIVGLLAQGVAPLDAAVLGVFLHSAAGALVAADIGTMGALASDLLPRLPQALKQLKMG